MIRVSTCLTLCLALLTHTSSAYASTQKTLKHQRQTFQQAKIALKQKDMPKFQILRKSIPHYPLTPYLDIWQAFQWIQQENDFSVWQVLQKHPDIPEVNALRQTWVQSLASRGQWPQVAEQLKHINHSAQHYPIITALALWYNGHQHDALAQLSQAWQSGKGLPNHAPKLLAAWKSSGHPNHQDLWQRLLHLIQHKQWSKTKDLTRHLSLQEQSWIRLWKQVQKKPEHGLLISHIYHVTPNIMAKITHDGLRHLARHDIEKAWHILQRIHPQLNQHDFIQEARYLALRAAKQHNPIAIPWFTSLPQAAQTADTYAWHARLLLMKKQWNQSLKVIQSMPEQQQMTARWLYWQGYILEHLQHPQLARQLYEQASMERGYYSFLSAKHIHQPYRMKSKPLPDITISKAFEQQAAIQRAKEWLYWQKNNKARAEWQYALRHASQDTWKQAMKLAWTWQWHDQVIRTASHARAWNVLEARFPMAYRKQVHTTARKHHLDQELIWSIIRQESAFNPEAVSRTGAKGLMQLMPTTAQHVVHKHHLNSKLAQDLFNPQYNIQLGSQYIADMMQRFQGHTAVAIAAYNAGPNRVSSWLEAYPMSDEALWIELIPFHETRRYVQHVLSFRIVYAWLKKQSSTPLIAQKHRDFLTKPSILASSP